MRCLRFLVHLSLVFAFLSLGMTAAPLDSVGDPPAHFDVIPVMNPSFESFPLADGQFTRPFWTSGSFVIVTSDPIPGWKLDPVTGDGGTFNPKPAQYPGQAPDGSNVAYGSGGLYGRLIPTIVQRLPDVLLKNRTYVLEVEIGNRLDTPFPGYSVQLLAGGILLAEDDSGLHPAPGTFQRTRLAYRAGPHDPALGEQFEIRLRSNGLQTNFDDVTLVVYRGNAILDAVSGEEFFPPWKGKTLPPGMDAQALPPDAGSPVHLRFAPNPLRGAGTAWLSFPRGGEPYRLDVFDAQGRRVMHLADGASREAGLEIVWNGGDDRGDVLPSGVYYLRLITGDDVAVAKILKLD